VSAYELWDVREIAEYRGMAYCGVYKWLARRGLRPVGVRGFGRRKVDLFAADDVRAAHEHLPMPDPISA
jgi:hypothetical protein